MVCHKKPFRDTLLVFNNIIWREMSEEWKISIDKPVYKKNNKQSVKLIEKLAYLASIMNYPVKV